MLLARTTFNPQTKMPLVDDPTADPIETRIIIRS
jgi:hypothetical protein